jgi:MFS family permease
MAQRSSYSFFRRNPTFFRFLGASTVSLLGSNVFDIALPIYVWQRTQSAMMLAMSTMALNLPYLLAAPWTGFSADHFDKRRTLLVADVASAMLMVFLLGYDLSSFASVWPILATVFLVKSCTILFETVVTFRLIPSIVGPGDLALANSWFLSSLRLVQVLGPLLGGLAMTAFGMRGCVALNILSFIATIGFVAKSEGLRSLLLEDSEGDERATGKTPKFSMTQVIEEFVESLRFVAASPLFRAFVPLMFLWNLSPLITGTPTLTYYFTVRRAFSAAEYGAVVSMIGLLGIVGYAAGSYLYDRYRFSRVFVASALWQAGLGTLSLLFFGLPSVFALTFAISRAGSSTLNMGTFLVRQTRIPKGRAGSVNTALRMLFMTAAPLSAFLQGWMLDTVGVFVPLVLGAACLWGTLHYSQRVGEAYDEKATPKRRSTDAEAA